MDKWINLTAIWQITVVGLIAGAGLPAIFAVGVRVLTPPEAAHGPAGVAADGSTSTATVAVRSTPRLIAASACFAVVVAGIAWGLYLIVAST